MEAGRTDSRPEPTSGSANQTMESNTVPFAGFERGCTVVTLPFTTVVVLWDEIENGPEYASWITLQHDDGCEAWSPA